MHGGTMRARNVQTPSHRAPLRKNPLTQCTPSDMFSPKRVEHLWVRKEWPIRKIAML